MATSCKHLFLDEDGFCETCGKRVVDFREKHRPSTATTTTTTRTVAGPKVVAKPTPTTRRPVKPVVAAPVRTHPYVSVTITKAGRGGTPIPEQTVSNPHISVVREWVERLASLYEVKVDVTFSLTTHHTSHRSPKSDGGGHDVVFGSPLLDNYSVNGYFSYEGDRRLMRKHALLGVRGKAAVILVVLHEFSHVLQFRHVGRKTNQPVHTHEFYQIFEELVVGFLSEIQAAAEQLS